MFVKNLCGVMYTTRDPQFNFLILKQFSLSRSLDGTICLLILGSSMSVHNAIAIV